MRTIILLTLLALTLPAPASARAKHHHHTHRHHAHKAEVEVEAEEPCIRYEADGTCIVAEYDTTPEELQEEKAREAGVVPVETEEGEEP